MSNGSKLKVISLFAGIGGFDLAFERAGFEVVACVEIDKNCRELLASKFSSAVIHDDVTTAGAHNLPPCDIITYGFPCQDLSVAGRREGLQGERSGLFYEAMRIIDELKPTWALWENVPGLLSSQNGRDLANVLLRLAESNYYGCVRRLDSQWFGVAQRRRRLFGVFTRGDSGAAGCAEVLSIAEGLRGHPPPSREKGEGATRDVAPCLTGGGIGTRSATGSRGQDCVIPVVSRTITANEGRGGIPSSYGLDGKLIPVAHPSGFDEQDDRPVVVKTANTKSNGGNVSTDGVSYTLDSAPNQAVLAFDMAHADDPARETGDKVNTLQARMGTGGNQVPCVCLNDQGGSVMNISHDVAGTLRQQSKGHEPSIPTRYRVRRLTPVECEKLQSFPVGWTEGFADSVRYKMLGNAVTVNVAEWIAKRLKNLIDTAKQRGTP